MSAADVEFVQDHAVRGSDVGHGGDHPADGLAVQRRIGDLRSDVTVQSDQLEKWLVQNPFHCVGGVTAGEGEAELLVVDAGRHRGVAVDVDVGCHPDQHPLRPSHFAGQVGDLHERVDDDAADAHRGGVVELVERLGVAVHDDPRRIDASRERGRQLTAGADVDARTLLGYPARDVGGQQRLGGIDDFGVAQCGAVAIEPVPKVGFVENVCGCAELVGDVRQRHISDAEAAQVVDGCGRTARSPGLFGSRRRGARTADSPAMS